MAAEAMEVTPPVLTEGAEAPASDIKEGGEAEKKKRGKPKDPLAPPKPKNGYSKFAGPMREKLKETKPELLSDLSAMGKAIAEEWAKVPQEEKDRLQAEYEKEMEIWKPKMEAYKKTDHYKEFVEIKTDWVDARMRKKLQKKMTTDAPKRPKSGYMIFASEIREGVLEKVKAENLGLGDVGRIISERWQALSEAEKAKYAEMSAEQKKTFDVEFLKYAKSESFKSYMDSKAKLESKQGLKKIQRTCLGDAPKKAPSAYGLYRSEVMPSITADNEKAKTAGDEKLDMAGIARKVSAMWTELPEDKKAPYFKKAEDLKQQYLKEYQDFKTGTKYSSFIENREKIKTKENKQLHLRDMPKRPKSVFALFAEDNKNKVEAGKGEGKGRSALKTLWNDAAPEVKAEYENKEKELKDQWLKDVEEYKSGERFKTFEATAQKVKQEFQTEAIKVTTMKFLREAPKPPAKTAFAQFWGDKRKREEADAPEGEKKSKAAKREEIERAKQEFLKLGKDVQAEFETRRKEQLKAYEEECKAYMATERWQEYVKEAKRLKIPVKSLLFHKKKIIKKLQKGMKPGPSSIPLPKRPETYPTKPRTAMQIFLAEKKGTGADTLDISKGWEELDEEGKKKYEDLAREDATKFDEAMQQFRTSDEGKTYMRELSSAQRRKRVLAAKIKYLDNLPKKPSDSFRIFQSARLAEVKKANPGKKGFELKKALEEQWRALDDSERKRFDDEAAEKMKEHEEKMAEFKKSDQFKAFQRAIRVRKPKMKVKSKAKGKGKGKGKGAAKALLPEKPESMPKKPISAFLTFCREQPGGGGKPTAELSKAWKELDEEKRNQMEQEAKEREQKHAEDMDAFNKSDEGKQYNKLKRRMIATKLLQDAKAKYLVDQPKKPQSAYFIFLAEKRPEVQANPEVKGLAEMQQKLAEMWKNLSDEDKSAYANKEKEKLAEYEKQLEEFKSTANYKKYLVVANRVAGKPKAKAKGKGKGKGKAAKPGIPMPPKPEGLPKKPPSGMIAWALDQKEKTGKSMSLKQMSEGWLQLGAEGQKPFMEKAHEQVRKYEEDLKAFQKTAEGKKYFRLKAAAINKERIKKARDKFLGAGKDGDAPQEPKRPPSAYFIFVQEKRSEVSSLKPVEQAKKLTEMWKGLDADAKKQFDDKAEALKKKYDEEMAAYKSSANYKRYQKAFDSITGKRAQLAKAKAKAKAALAKEKAAKAAEKAAEKAQKAPDTAGRGRGGAVAGGRGKGGGKATGRGAPPKRAASDSDSDVMGSDSDSSSSSDSD